MNSFHMIFSLCTVLTYSITNGQLQCMDDNNEPVDWFALYKIPKVHHDNQLIKDGVGYVYVTSKNHEQWFFSKYSINDSDSMIGNTLKPFYSIEKNISYVLYNDQPPNEPKKAQKGHTKGVILADTSGGFWLVHSVPHFPPLSSKYEYSKTGLLKGQSFLCISLDLKNLNKVGTQLQYNEAQIYAGHLQESAEAKLMHVNDAVSGIVVTQPPWFNQIPITSKNGMTFMSFAKSKHFGKELYVDWVAPALQQDLYVETWQNGPGKISSKCNKKFHVYNVLFVKIDAGNVSFSSTDDHSKWAASVHFNWTCIGDINRMEHQKERGGGTVCLNDGNFTQIYRGSVESIQKCFTNLF